MTSRNTTAAFRRIDTKNVKKLHDRLLGVGASASVFLGVDMQTGTFLAIKEVVLNTDPFNALPPPDLSIKSEQQQQQQQTITNEERRKILNEVDLCSRCPYHPNCCQFIGARIGPSAVAEANQTEAARHEGFDPKKISGSAAAAAATGASDGGVNEQHEEDQQDFVLDLIFEYVSGGSLRGLIQAVGPLPEHLAVSYTRDMVRALVHLHNVARIGHRDLKTSNVLLTSEGTAKVCDLGTSRARFVASAGNQQGGASTSSSAGSSMSTSRQQQQQQQQNNHHHLVSVKMRTVVGTAAYMAPEVARASGGSGPNEDEDDDDAKDDKSYSGPSADIWSLGCVVFEMLTGSAPFEELGNVFAILFQLASEERALVPVVPEHRAALYSPAAVDFVKVCCQRDPRKRPTAKELVKHEWLAPVPPASGAAAGCPPPPQAPMASVGAASSASATTTAMNSESTSNSSVTSGQFKDGIMLEDGMFVDLS